MKLKKQTNELKEMMQQKNEEIDDLKRNIKSTKLQEIQEEVQLYQKECLKLRYIAEVSICILVQNGLESQLKKNRRLRHFIKTINWKNFEIQNAMSDIQRLSSAELVNKESGSVERNVRSGQHRRASMEKAESRSRSRSAQKPSLGPHIYNYQQEKRERRAAPVKD